ncbi:hypothetical protein ABH922_005222 [Rhodococcus sp. 27YEA15]
MASSAAPSPSSFSPRLTQRPEARAPVSVTRTSSIAGLRSGISPMTGLSARVMLGFLSRMQSGD